MEGINDSESDEDASGCCCLPKLGTGGRGREGGRVGVASSRVFCYAGDGTSIIPYTHQRRQKGPARRAQPEMGECKIRAKREKKGPWLPC